jgi:hypothetical protein
VDLYIVTDKAKKGNSTLLPELHNHAVDISGFGTFSDCRWDS